MICEHCHGLGTQLTEGKLGPCMSCGGCGIGHCCEGMVGGPFEEAAQSASTWGTTPDGYLHGPANSVESANSEGRAIPMRAPYR